MRIRFRCCRTYCRNIQKKISKRNLCSTTQGSRQPVQRVEENVWTTASFKMNQKKIVKSNKLRSPIELNRAVLNQDKTMHSIVALEGLIRSTILSICFY